MELPQDITLEQICQRAYDLWKRNHRLNGFEIGFWLMAERELKGERNRGETQRDADNIRTLSTDPEVQLQESGTA